MVRWSPQQGWFAPLFQTNVALFVQGTMGYVLSKSGVKEIFEHLTTEPELLRQPIDMVRLSIPAVCSSRTESLLWPLWHALSLRLLPILSLRWAMGGRSAPCPKSSATSAAKRSEATSWVDPLSASLPRSVLYLLAID